MHTIVYIARPHRTSASTQQLIVIIVAEFFFSYRSRVRNETEKSTTPLSDIASQLTAVSKARVQHFMPILCRNYLLS